MLSKIEQFDSLEGFGGWLRAPADWVGAFDFPFGLPRELVEQLGWPTAWEACMRHYAGLSREEIRATFAAFCDARPVGGKFAHRATDRPAGASPSMKWVNPPVAYMLHAGVPMLLDAGVYLPGHQPIPPTLGHAAKVAVEAYPGLLAREVLGRRSYKSDEKAKQNPERQHHRHELVQALERGHTTLGLALDVDAVVRDVLVQDASGDSLDAVLCLLQAAWASVRGAPLYGLPADLDRLEGWIITAGATPVPV